MPRLEIPPRLMGAFMSEIPRPEKLVAVGETEWGSYFLQNAANWAQFGLARVWTQLDVPVPSQAQSLLDLAIPLLDARRSWENAATVGDRLKVISEGSLKVLETIMDNIAGLAGAVPVIGIVARVGISIQTQFWSNWVASRTLPQGAPGFKYNYDVDQDEQRFMLQAIESGDITSIFLPYEMPDRLEVRMVQSKRRLDRRDWFVNPRGKPMGLGYLPGGLGNQLGYEGRGPKLFSDYTPGALSASIVAWELARTQLRPYVDFDLIRSSWVEFFNRIERLGREHAWEIPQDDATQKAIELGRIWPTPETTVADALRPIHLADAFYEGTAAGTPKYGLPPGNVLDEPPGGRTMAQVVADVVDAATAPATAPVVSAVPVGGVRASAVSAGPVSKLFPSVVAPVRRGGGAGAVAAAVLGTGAVVGTGWLLWRFLFR